MPRAARRVPRSRRGDPTELRGPAVRARVSVCLLAGGRAGALAGEASRRRAPRDRHAHRPRRRADRAVLQARPEPRLPEKVIVQPVGSDRTPAGFAPRRSSPSCASSRRAKTASRPTHDHPRAVEGERPAAEAQDKKDRHLPRPESAVARAAVVSPRAISGASTRSPGPGSAKARIAIAFLIDYRPVEASEQAEFLEDRRGTPRLLPDLAAGGRRGRLWVDATTYDVLRLEQHLRAPVDVRIPFVQQRKHNLPDSWSSIATTRRSNTSAWRSAIRRSRCCCRNRSRRAGHDARRPVALQAAGVLELPPILDRRKGGEGVTAFSTTSST